MEEKDDFAEAFGAALGVEDEPETESPGDGGENAGEGGANQGEGSGEEAAVKPADEGSGGEPDPELFQAAEAAGKQLLERQQATQPTEAKVSESKPEESKAAVVDDATAVVLPPEIQGLFEDIPELAKAIELKVEERITKLAAEGKLGGGEAHVLAPMVAGLINKVFWLELSAAFPDARATASSPEFHAWVKAQSSQIQALHGSPHAGDAVALLKLYKSTQGKPEGGEKKPAREKVIALHGHSLAGNVNAVGKVAKPDTSDFSGAFAEAVKGV